MNEIEFLRRSGLRISERSAPLIIVAALMHHLDDMMTAVDAGLIQYALGSQEDIRKLLLDFHLVERPNFLQFTRRVIPDTCLAADLYARLATAYNMVIE